MADVVREDVVRDGIPDDRVFDDYPESVANVKIERLKPSPVSQEHMVQLLSSVQHFSEASAKSSKFDNSEFMEESRKFRQIESSELQSFLDWMSSQSDMYNFIVVGKGETTDPVSIKDITLSPSKLPHGTERAIEESWVMVPEDDLLASQFVSSHPELQQKLRFFDDWPSFGVYDKVTWVLSKTGTAFCWGYLIGAKAALDSLYSFTRHPIVAGGVGLAAGFAAYASPQLLLTALEYVVIGGVFGGATVAAPVIIIGSTGIFATASIYHTYQLAKRSIQKAAQIPVKPSTDLALKK